MQEILFPSAQLAAIDASVWLPLLAVLACPLMCVLMMLFGWCSNRQSACCGGGKKCEPDENEPKSIGENGGRTAIR